SKNNQKNTIITPCIIALGLTSLSIPVIIPSVLRIMLKKLSKAVKSDLETLVVKGKSVVSSDEGCEKDVKETVEKMAEEEGGGDKDLTLEIKNEDNKRMIDVKFVRKE
ncbi:23638_t:CDS:2, partial [Entrophospora sp. SA101]